MPGRLPRRRDPSATASAAIQACGAVAKNGSRSSTATTPMGVPATIASRPTRSDRWTYAAKHLLHCSQSFRGWCWQIKQIPHDSGVLGPDGPHLDPRLRCPKGHRSFLEVRPGFAEPHRLVERPGAEIGVSRLQDELMAAAQPPLGDRRGQHGAGDPPSPKRGADVEIADPALVGGQADATAEAEDR